MSQMTEISSQTARWWYESLTECMHRQVLPRLLRVWTWTQTPWIARAILLLALPHRHFPQCLTARVLRSWPASVWFVLVVSILLPVSNLFYSSCLHAVQVYGGASRPSSSMPKTENASACEAICKSRQNCTYGTWHDQNQGLWKNTCFLKTDHVYHPRRQTGHTSFLCNTTANLPSIPEPDENQIQYLFEPQPFETGLPKRHTGWSGGPTCPYPYIQIYIHPNI